LVSHACANNSSKTGYGDNAERVSSYEAATTFSSFSGYGHLEPNTLCQPKKTRNA
jgi:hypothetical protein